MDARIFRTRRRRNCAVSVARAVGFKNAEKVASLSGELELENSRDPLISHARRLEKSRSPRPAESRTLLRRQLTNLAIRGAKKARPVTEISNATRSLNRARAYE